jgi:hypothetical protein
MEPETHVMLLCRPSVARQRAVIEQREVHDGTVSGALA